MELNLYKAVVVDIKDNDKQGKIKLRILPELEKVDDELLPWAVPFISMCSTNRLMNDLPEINSTVRVLVDKYWKRFYYLSNAYFYNIFQYNKVESVLSKVSVDTTYENIKFNLYEDGGLEFHNKKDGSHGFIHKSGSYAIFDKNGSIVCETPNQTIKLSNTVDSLGSLLEELITDLSGLTTVGSPTTQTSPTLTTQMETLLPKVKKLLK